MRLVLVLVCILVAGCVDPPLAPTPEPTRRQHQPLPTTIGPLHPPPCDRFTLPEGVCEAAAEP